MFHYSAFVVYKGKYDLEISVAFPQLNMYSKTGHFQQQYRLCQS